MPKSLCFSWLLVLSVSLWAQVLPREGSVLNYRIIGFSFLASPVLQKEHNYKIEIAEGNYNNVNSFKQHIIKTRSDKTHRMIAEVPRFGSQYTWRVVYDDKALPSQYNVLHHFSTAIIPNVDTTDTRLRILKRAVKYKDAYVFLDGNRALYDMDGRPVWFLPKVDSIDNIKLSLRDLKLSPQGTITFLTGTNIYEINYNGAILWKGPYEAKVSGDEAEHYHHEFTRLNNGRYMVLGSEYLPWKTDSASGKLTFAGPGNKDDNRTEFGTVIEYDKEGKIIWSWRSSTYYKAAWLAYSGLQGNREEMHENSFFFDEKTKSLYISFKNVNQVIKVKYPEGNIAATYGRRGRSDLVSTDENLFCMQHSCKISGQGYLYLFNNNSCHLLARPQVIMLQEPRNKKEHLKKIWEYEYPLEPAAEKLPEEIAKRPTTTVGGNVMELPGHAMFASLCSPYSNIFIVSHGKELLWDAIPEKWDPEQKKWKAAPEYRASIIKGRKDLEQLIWNSEQ